MNNDLISREALKEALDRVQYTQEFCIEHQIDYSISMQMLGMIIDNAPTVERPQGEWITRHKQNSFGQDIVCFECNKCGEYKLPIIHTMITDPLGVCPNCGAKMANSAK